MVVVVFPLVYNLDNYPFKEAHEFVKEAGKECGFMVIDLLPYFEGKGEEQIAVSAFDTHPNEIGNEIAAFAIYEDLINKSLVKRKNGPKR